MLKTTACEAAVVTKKTESRETLEVVDLLN